MSITTPHPTPYDSSSSAYKKARKQYLKTARRRDEQVETDWTPFRAAEKAYKAKFPPPDLSQVLDIALLDEKRLGEVKQGVWKGATDVVGYQEIELRGDYTAGRRRAYIFPQIPGLVLLPSFVSPEEQQHLVQWSLKDHARYPNETNLDTHYILPLQGLWNAFLKSRYDGQEEEDIQPRATTSTFTAPAPPPGPRQLISNESASKENFIELASKPALPAAPSPNAKASPASSLVPKLRWANIGWYYHWGNKQYDFTRGKVEVAPIYTRVCKAAVKAVPWEKVFDRGDEGDWGEDGPEWHTWDETYEPDAGIVNYYQTKDTLMAHVDRSEVCATSPLVSISLGCAAIFLIGGTSRETKPIPIFLRSGDVVIMSGPRCRRAYHGVPRILEGTVPRYSNCENDEEWRPYQDYLTTTRININVRQVFPKGFRPKML